MIWKAPSPPATRAGTVLVGGDLPVHRIGFGAMRLVGPRAWGPLPDSSRAAPLLRRALSLGVNLIDTADYYGPHPANQLIADVLAPYPSDLVLSTKTGVRRGEDASWQPAARPEEIRADVEGNLRRLRVDRLDLVHLRMGDGRVLAHSDVPLAESLGALAELQAEGRIRHIGLSCVGVEQVEEARSLVHVAAVQNLYNIADRRSQDVLDLCTREEIAFLAYFPLGTGKLAAAEEGVLAAVAERHWASPAQVALASLLAISPMTIPIPGTSSVVHLEENVGAAALQLDEEEIEALR